MSAGSAGCQLAVRVAQSEKLSVLTEAEHRLSTIKTVAEAKEVRDQAEALRAYARRSRRGLAAQNRCARIKLRAERKGGELLAAIERQQGQGGGRGRRKTSADARTKFQRALKDAGISRSTASDWQLLAAFPLEDLEAFFVRTMDTGEIVSRYVYDELREMRRREELARDADEQPPPPAKRDPSTYTDEELHGQSLPTDLSIERYRRSTIRQLTLGFAGPEYGHFVERLDHVMQEEEVSTRKEAVLRVLDAWERREEALGPSLRFRRRTVKQVVMTFDKGADYDRVVDRLTRVRESEEVPTHTAAVLRALDAWEETHKSGEQEAP